MLKLHLKLLFIFLILSCCAQAAEYTTFIGDTNVYRVARVAVDSAGNTYVAGTRMLDASSDVFLVKLDPAGNVVLFRAISGKGTDTAADMALDAAGNIYIGGSTTSTSFPVHNALQTTPGPGFLLKLNADGSQMVWATYFREAVAALVVDAGGNVYVTGSTTDHEFPAPPASPYEGTGTIAFLAKIAPAGDRVLSSVLLSGGTPNCSCCSSCFGRATHTAGVSVAVDPAGNAYLAGNTDSLDLRTTPGAFLAVGTGAFAAKIKADGSGIAYLTFISNTHYSDTPNFNTATAIAADADGNAYLTGTTFDPQFPATKGAFQTNFSGPANSSSVDLPPADAFVLKLNPSGTALVWASYLGGRAAETVSSVTVDAAQQVWLTGTTASPDFPNAQGWSQGADFITGFDATGSKLNYSARYPNGAVSQAVAVDTAGALHVSGPSGIVSLITPFAPPTPRIFGVANAAGGPVDGRVAPGEVVSIYGPHIGPATPIILPQIEGKMPTAAPGYQVITGHGEVTDLPTPLPLLYLSDSQINAVIPTQIRSKLYVNTPRGTTPDFPLAEVKALPAVFRNPDNSAIAINQDGTLNAPKNPAFFGSYVSIWLTGSYGLGSFNDPGLISRFAVDYYCCGIVLNSTDYQPLHAFVSYAGTAPGAVLGVTQINFQVPVFPLFPNPAPVQLQVIATDGTLSDPVTVYITY